MPASRFQHLVCSLDCFPLGLVLVGNVAQGLLLLAHLVNEDGLSIFFNLDVLLVQEVLPYPEARILVVLVDLFDEVPKEALGCAVLDGESLDGMVHPLLSLEIQPDLCL